MKIYNNLSNSKIAFGNTETKESPTVKSNITDANFEIVKKDIKTNLDTFVSSSLKGYTDDELLKESFKLHPTQFFKNMSEKLGKLTTHRQAKVFSSLEKVIDTHNEMLKDSNAYQKDFSAIKNYRVYENFTSENKQAFEHYLTAFSKLAEKNGFSISKLIKIGK